MNSILKHRTQVYDDYYFFNVVRLSISLFLIVRVRLPINPIYTLLRVSR